MNTASFYATRDLGEAAALLTAGQNLLRLQSAGRHFLFCFRGKTVCERLAQNYWNGALRLEARAFALSLRSLKDRIHTGR